MIKVQRADMVDTDAFIIRDIRFFGFFFKMPVMDLKLHISER